MTFYAGDLNKLFQRILTSYDHLTPTVLSRPPVRPWIIQFDTIASITITWIIIRTVLRYIQSHKGASERRFAVCLCLSEGTIPFFADPAPSYLTTIGTTSADAFPVPQ